MRNENDGALEWSALKGGSSLVYRVSPRGITFDSSKLMKTEICRHGDDMQDSAIFWPKHKAAVGARLLSKG